MNLLPGTQRITADIAVGTSGKPIRVFAVHLVSGASDSTLIFLNGTSTANTTYCQVDGVANEGVTLNFAGGMRFPAGCFADVDANINYATVVYTEEF